MHRMSNTASSCCESGCLALGHGQAWRRRLRDKLPKRNMVKLYLILFLNMFVNSFSITMLFPYLPFLIEFLMPELQQEDVGKYAGFVGGAMYAGRILGSYVWGVLSDRFGRKSVTIISSVLVALSTLVFGFSVNYAMALIVRFLAGITNGILVMSKAVVSEVSDDSNQALGHTVVGTAWGTGYIIGPAISGAIADPISQYNLTITNPFLHGFLTKFPFSLPAIVSTLLFVISIVLTIFCLPETLGMKKNRKRSEVIDLVQLHSRIAETSDADPTQGENHTDETWLLSNDGCSEETNEVAMPTPKGEEIEEVRMRESREEEEEEEEEEGVQVETVSSRTSFIARKKSLLCKALKNLLLSLKLILCNCVTLNLLLIYCAYAFAVTGFIEVFSLWAYTRPDLGGLGFSLHEIGICLTIVGVLELPISLLAFPLLEKRLKSIRVLYFMATSATFLVSMVPHSHYLVSHKAALWIVLVILTLFAYASFTVGFSAITLLINNSVTFDKLGSINGIALTMGSITRSISPVVCGPLFSLSLSEGTREFGYPVDHNLVFVVLSVTFMVSVFMAACLPTSLNNQKIIEDL